MGVGDQRREREALQACSAGTGGAEAELERPVGVGVAERGLWEWESGGAGAEETTEGAGRERPDCRRPERKAEEEEPEPGGRLLVRVS